MMTVVRANQTTINLQASGPEFRSARGHRFERRIYASESGEPNDLYPFLIPHSSAADQSMLLLSDSGPV